MTKKIINLHSLVIQEDEDEIGTPMSYHRKPLALNFTEVCESDNEDVPNGS
jgi:hypothetical protein